MNNEYNNGSTILLRLEDLEDLDDLYTEYTIPQYSTKGILEVELKPKRMPNKVNTEDIRDYSFKQK